MDKQELLEAVSRLRPAIKSTGDMPAYGAVFFDGDDVSAFTGDEITIVTPFASEFVGAVEAKPFIAWLEGLPGDGPIGVKQLETTVTLSYGRSRITLPVFGQGVRVHRLANTSSIEVFEPVGLVEAMGVALPFYGWDEAHPTRLGLTIQVDDVARVLATNDATLISVAATVVPTSPLVADVPETLAKAMVSYAKKVEPEVLEFGDGWCLARFADGTTIYGATGREISTDAYDRVLARHAGGTKDFGIITDDVRQSLRNVARVVSASKEEAIALRVIDGVLSVLTDESGRVAMRDEAMFDHPDASIWVDAPSLLRVIDGSFKMRVSREAVVAVGPDRVAMVAERI